MIPDWQLNRGQLNHNWLQNGILVALNHALEIVAGGVRPRSAGRAIEEDVSRWMERRREISQLLDRFEDEMSPRVYFDRPPLSRCPVETKRWLMPLTHELWLGRESVKKRIAAAMKAYRRADKKFEALRVLLKTLPDSPALDYLRPLEWPLRDFAKDCEALSGSISALPHGIRCV